MFWIVWFVSRDFVQYRKVCTNSSHVDIFSGCLFFSMWFVHVKGFVGQSSAFKNSLIFRSFTVACLRNS